MQHIPIYTVGHSNHQMTTFLRLLQDHGIQVIVDVRSAPYSRFVPQFNKRELEAAVKKHDIRYIFMGDSLGGKPSETEYLEADGQVKYHTLAAAPRFQQGLNRLADGLAQGWIIALLCAEEDPLKCHRHHLIAKELECERHIPVNHIRSDGTITRAGNSFKHHPNQLTLFNI